MIKWNKIKNSRKLKINIETSYSAHAECQHQETQSERSQQPPETRQLPSSTRQRQIPWCEPTRWETAERWPGVLKGARRSFVLTISCPLHWCKNKFAVPLCAPSSPTSSSTCSFLLRTQVSIVRIFPRKRYDRCGRGWASNWSLVRGAWSAWNWSFTCHDLAAIERCAAALHRQSRRWRGRYPSTWWEHWPFYLSFLLLFFLRLPVDYFKQHTLCHYSLNISVACCLLF